MGKKTLVIAGVAVAVLAGGGAVAFLTLRPKHAEAPATARAHEEPGMVAMDPFLVNITDPTGDRYVKVNLRLAVSSAKLAEAIKIDELLQARMRDRVLTLLGSKSREELSDPLGKEGFRREIKTHLQPLIADGEIQEVLFADFIVQ
jgi:flagellar FliL protein